MAAEASKSGWFTLLVGDNEAMNLNILFKTKMADVQNDRFLYSELISILINGFNYILKVLSTSKQL